LLGSEFYSKERKGLNSGKNRSENNSSFLKKSMI
jgi:hypothetical protein